MPDRENAFDRLMAKIIPKPPPLVLPGIYHAMREVNGVPTRLHLRVEHDGSGILMANSKAAARLTPPGVIIAKGLLDNAEEEVILKNLKKRFRGASKETMKQDKEQVQNLLNQILTPGMEYPIINFDTFLASKARLIAPLKADVPLASPDTMVPLIDKLWEVGIPNMMLLVPENPDPTHIIRAIERAEDLGMIAGVRVRASDLQQNTLIYDMAQAGVDYITVLYTSVHAETHDALCGEGDHAIAEQVIKEVHTNEVCPVAEVALVESTIDTIHETMQALQALHVENVSFFTIYVPFEVPPVGSVSEGRQAGALPSRGMRPIETLIAELADDMNMACTLQPAVEYDPGTSLASQVREGPRCSGDVAVRVEANGSVIPARGPYRSAGNILADSWEHIWGHEAFRNFRESVEQDEEDAIPETA
jgi:MoaA/NifB/PqqE/SkfB family radical SAM enzyme